MFSIEKRLAQVTTVCAKAYFNNATIHENMGNYQPFSFAELPEDNALKIVSGKALVAKEVRGQHILLCQLGPEDVLGNIPFLGTSHEPHSAGVFVSDPFETVALDLIDLKEEYDELSQTFRNLVSHTSTCLSVTTGRLMDMIARAEGP